jgi:hypothetical protein
MRKSQHPGFLEAQVPWSCRFHLSCQESRCSVRAVAFLTPVIMTSPIQIFTVDSHRLAYRVCRADEQHWRTRATNLQWHKFENCIKKRNHPRISRESALTCTKSGESCWCCWRTTVTMTSKSGSRTRRGKQDVFSKSLSKYFKKCNSYKIFWWEYK